MSFFVMLGLLVCTGTPGSMTDDSVFVRKGGNVLLSVKDPVTLGTDILFWKLNQSVNIARYIYKTDPTIFEGYEQRAVFSVQNLSLLLKNLQQNDTGTYTAVVTKVKDQIVATHRVIVQEPVSAVSLTVDSVSSSSGCNLTVTCSTQDSDITSRVTCDNTNCHQEGGESSKVTTSGASLHLYLVNSTINCNHSNQVSWTKDTEDTGQTCPLINETLSGPSVCLVKTVVFSVGLIIMVSALIIVHVMDKFQKPN